MLSPAITCSMEISAAPEHLLRLMQLLLCRTWSFQRRKKYAEHNYQLQTAGGIAYSSLSLHDKYVSSSIIRYKENTI